MSDFDKKVKASLTEYKQRVLRVTEDGAWRGKKHPHILPPTDGHKNFLLDPSSFEIKNEMLYFPEMEKGIKLHQGWRHLNSSQVLCVSFFYQFVTDVNKLNELARFLGATSAAVNAEFEMVIQDRSNIDFVIHLEKGKDIYIEIKYCEAEFGKADIKKPEKTYQKIRNDHHASIDMSQKDYLENYQLVRNVCLSPKESGNLTVFLVPEQNDKINQSYAQGVKTIKNPQNFSFKRVYWEDLLQKFPNDEIAKKYFSV